MNGAPGRAGRPHRAALTASIVVLAAAGCAAPRTYSVDLPEVKPAGPGWYFECLARGPNEPRREVTLMATRFQDRGDSTARATWRIRVPRCVYATGDTAGVIEPVAAEGRTWHLSLAQVSAWPCTLRGELRGTNPDGSTDLVTWSCVLTDHETKSEHEGRDRWYGDQGFTYADGYLVPIAKHGDPRWNRANDSQIVRARLEDGSLTVAVPTAGAKRRVRVVAVVDDSGAPIAATVGDRAGLDARDLDRIRRKVKGLRFRPARYRNHPVSDLVHLTVNAGSD